MPSQPPPPSSSAALALPPGAGRNLSHQLPPRTPLAGVVGGSQMGSTGRHLSLKMNPFDSRIGANSATSADRNIPRNYPHQETATPSSTHASSPVRLKPSVGVLGTAGMGSNRLEVGISWGQLMMSSLSWGERGVVSMKMHLMTGLVCPTCGRGFKIGQIQKYRQHAASCTHKKR